MSSMPSVELIHLGMDTSMNTIVVGVLRPGEEMPVVDRVFNDEESIRRLIGRFADRRLLLACYEAASELYRLLGAALELDRSRPGRMLPRLVDFIPTIALGRLQLAMVGRFLMPNGFRTAQDSPQPTRYPCRRRPSRRRPARSGSTPSTRRAA